MKRVRNTGKRDDRVFGAKEFIQGLAVGVLIGFLVAMLILG